MSKQELLELVAPLSVEERRELRELLEREENPAPMTDEEWENDAAKRFLEKLEQQPPLNFPPDFSVNHNHYIHGASKVEE